MHTTGKTKRLAEVLAGIGGEMMGKEIRRVPARYQHPRQDCAHSQWYGGCGEAQRTDGTCFVPRLREEMPTGEWYQVFETVSEGTPLTPPFATQGELVKYLVTYGDFWQQYDREGAWDEAAAERFVFETQWLPSAIMVNRENL